MMKMMNQDEDDKDKDKDKDAGRHIRIIDDISYETA